MKQLKLSGIKKMLSRDEMKKIKGGSGGGCPVTCTNGGKGGCTSDNGCKCNLDKDNCDEV